MYTVIENDGLIRSVICKNNKADRYGDPKLFKDIFEAKSWIKKHSYKGMSFFYEIADENGFVIFYNRGLRA